MTRSHPPSLLRHVRSTLEKECRVKRGDTIAVAVSGGPDSLALLHALSFLKSELGFQLAALSIDHGLRAEAAQEVEFVGRFCAEINVPFWSEHLSLEDGPNLQARARDARYRALWRLIDEHLAPGTLLATAHHKEDRAETILMRLLRGTSLEGLSVLPPRRERLIRPMIRASRVDVLAHVERHRLTPCQDPSNRDLRFLRVQTRQELLPLMEKLGPGIVDHLVELSDEAALLPEPLGLNREQRQQIRQALCDPAARLDLRLPGGISLTRTLGGKSGNKSVK